MKQVSTKQTKSGDLQRDINLRESLFFLKRRSHKGAESIEGVTSNGEKQSDIAKLQVANKHVTREKERGIEIYREE